MIGATNVLVPLRSNSVLSRIDPRCRLLAALALIVTAVSFSSWQPLAMLVLVAAIITGFAKPDWSRTLKMVLTMDGFIFVMLIMLPFTVSGDVIFTLWGFDASYQGLFQAVLIALKANAAILVLIALVGGMDAILLGRGLQGIYVPAKLVTLFMFTIRYIDLLRREYLRLRVAMRARAFVARNNRHSWRSFGYLLGMLLVRGHDRSERILWAMKCRAYHGHMHFGSLPRLSTQDYLFATAVILFIGTLIGLEVACPALI
ncbi:cobalt ECF transporter T component CbiQ [Thalassospira sp. MCCC 1A03138]|uniref:cobalt ECF transporter T component CbiQ n=1 Tax=Thalassospira sp. MCCC 1A03138 TaxID=1470576 RepID=UPI000A1DD8AA|nr:cobalt ECF transporter T component CbiQ [Thalassospira sp. MCCC 1A03138]OSQ29743.1 hypothetical protein TH468_13030 [Thalassospira sp. MCCC 1A03138]